MIFNSNGIGYIILPNKEKDKFKWELVDFSLIFNGIEKNNCFEFGSYYCINKEKGDRQELILSKDINITNIELKKIMQKDGSIIYEVYDDAYVYKLRKIR